MKEQLTPLYDIFLVPREVLLKLPSNRLYPVAFLILMYLNITRAFRPRTYQFFHDKVGGDFQAVLLIIVLPFVTIPLGCWILQSIIASFGKIFSLRKVINIAGYVAMPRFVVGIAATAALWLNPSLLEDQSNVITLTVFGIAAMLFNLFLLIYGIAICPSDDSSVELSKEQQPTV